MERMFGVKGGFRTFINAHVHHGNGYAGPGLQRCGTSYETIGLHVVSVTGAYICL